MNQDNKILLLSELQFDSKENKLLKNVIDLFSTPQENSEYKNGYPLIIIKKYLTEALSKTYYQDMDKKVPLYNEDEIKTLRLISSIISARLRKFVFKTDSFNYMGEVSSIDTVYFEKGYFVIEASSETEAKKLRDEMEAESFNKSNIDIKDLITIINNMERMHGSSGISPTKLKEIIKG